MVNVNIETSGEVATKSHADDVGKKSKVRVQRPLSDGYDRGLIRRPTTMIQSITRQYQNDSKDDEAISGVSGFMLKTLGLTATRRISNLIRDIGIGEFLQAKRTYPVFDPESRIEKRDGTALIISSREIRAGELAHRFRPILFTINEERLLNSALVAKEIRFEVLPPKRGSTEISILYYVKTDDEDMPIPVLGKLYDWVRPMLWGSKADWEVIQLDVDLETGKPVRLIYETSNCTSDPKSYYACKPSSLHLKCVVENKDRAWTHTTFQKNGESKTCEVLDPFKHSDRPNVAYVAWNGSFEMCSVLRDKGYGKHEQRLWQLDDPTCSFLDIATYKKEGFDLRAGLFRDRKKGEIELPLGSRPGVLVEEPVTI